MKRSLFYFIHQSIANIKNAHALRQSFWVGVFGMVLNNVSFFVIWFFFMKATGPINGWTTLDVFGMIGVSAFCYGVTHAFFYGAADLPRMVFRGNFDTVLLSPVNAFLKLSSSAFSISAYGDLLMGAGVVMFYGFASGLGLYEWILFLLAIVVGCMIFVVVRLLCSLVVFYINDGEIVAQQLFELFNRPTLFPGVIFPDTLKIFFMTIIPALLASAVPIDIVKGVSLSELLMVFLVTVVWIGLAHFLFKISVKRYESGNFLR